MVQMRGLRSGSRLGVGAAVIPMGLEGELVTPTMTVIADYRGACKSFDRAQPSLSTGVCWA